jgi:hypothetical protein
MREATGRTGRPQAALMPSFGRAGVYFPGRKICEQHSACGFRSGVL